MPTDRRDARKARRQEQVRAEILDATRRVLLERGLPGLTLPAVAKELELTKAALYYYFPSKEALVGELMVESLARHADLVGSAIDRAGSGAAALEALVRASADYYGARLDELRLTFMVPQVGQGAAFRGSPEVLARIRPFNERTYGAVAARIRADQDAGRVAASIDGRRLAFVAHLAVVGVLVMEGLVETTDRAPLIHARAAMIDEIVTSFVSRLTPPA